VFELRGYRSGSATSEVEISVLFGYIQGCTEVHTTIP
jgi:hypothetical protein